MKSARQLGGRPDAGKKALERIISPALTFLQRRAAAEFVRAVEAADLGERSLEKAAGDFWPEVGRLWICPTETEVALTLAAQALRRAADAAQESAEAIGEQRRENEISNFAERSLEREERRRARGQA